MTRRNGLLIGATGVVLLGVIAFFVLGGNDPEPSGPSGAVDTATEAPGESPDDSPATQGLTVPVYYVGDTPQGPRLYREFRSTEGTDDLSAAVDLAVSEPPLDPDYSVPWAESVGADASYDGDIITVDLSDSAGTPLHDPLTGMTPDEANIALQQLIYTAQGAQGEGRVPVQFLIDGQRTDQVLGQPTAEPLANAPVLETLSLVNVTTPAEGETVGNDLVVEGVSNSFEANVIVQLEAVGGGDLVFKEGVMAEGWMGEELFPFAQTFDISGVEPGTYVLTASTDDPSGGEEGFGPFTDTKTITVR